MITQLQTDYLPRLDRRSLKRNLSSAKRHVQKMAKAKSRKLNRAIITWYRSQYFLIHAFKDAKKAARNNEDIFIGTIIIALVIGYAMAAIATQLLFIFFETTYALADALNISMLLLTAITLGVVGVTITWVSAFIFNCMSIALIQSMNHKRQRSLRATLRIGLRHATRTTLAWTGVSIATFLPLMLVSLANLIIVKFSSFNVDTVRTVTPFVIGIATIWVVYAFARFSLAPYIAIFEPHLPLTLILRRSSELVRRKGHLFLLASYTSVAIALAVNFCIAYALNKVVGLDASLVFCSNSALVLVFGNAILVAFYRKRRLARTV